MPRFPIDEALVAGLVATQFPQWAHLPIRPVAHGGNDNRTYHLGEAMTVRLPSHAAYAAQVEKEQRWLPRLAPLLPLPIPAPLAMGRPDDSYPWAWSIYGWIDGEVAAKAGIADRNGFAADLGRFLVALQAIDASDGPAAGAHSHYRGSPVSTYDEQTRGALAALEGRIDTAAATEVWEEALAATWAGPPVWAHGDIAAGNLLVTNGRLGAVIDFGCSAVGDPACDLVIAWTFFDGESRAAFKAALPLDEGTWARGRGWAIWKALIVLAGRTNLDPLGPTASQAVIEAVVADHKGT